MNKKESEFNKVFSAWDILVIAFGAMIGWALYMAAAASLPTFSVTDTTSTVSVLAPKRIAITSPTFTS